MLPTLHERERLMIYTAARLAAEKKDRGRIRYLPKDGVRPCASDQRLAPASCPETTASMAPSRT